MHKSFLTKTVPGKKKTHGQKPPHPIPRPSTSSTVALTSPAETLGHLPLYAFMSPCTKAWRRHCFHGSLPCHHMRHRHLLRYWSTLSRHPKYQSVSKSTDLNRTGLPKGHPRCRPVPGQAMLGGRPQGCCWWTRVSRNWLHGTRVS